MVAAIGGGGTGEEAEPSRLPVFAALLDHLGGGGPPGLASAGAEAILDRLGVGIVQVAGGRIVWINEPGSALLGWAAGELCDAASSMLFAVADEGARFLAAAPPTGPVECRLRRKDGKAMWGRVFSVPFAASAPDVGTLLVFEDVTLRKEAQESLRLATAVFETSNEAIMICDAEGRIVMVNAAFSAITGYPGHEIAGRDPEFLKSGRHDEAFVAAQRLLLERDGMWQGEVWSRRKGGEAFLEWLTINAIAGDEGHVEYTVSIFTDITKRKQDEELIIYQANYDALTDMPNRQLLQDRVHQATVQAGRSGERVAVLYLDLDNFKYINDSLGHGAGDTLLVEMARRMTSCLRDQDTIGRLGGDEFLIVVPKIHAADEATAVARRVLDSVARPMHLEGRGHDIVMTASIGISLFPDDGPTADALIRNADTAAFHAKQAGRNAYQFFTDEMNVRALERLSLENKLRRALEQDELVLHYQPKVELRHGRIVGVEALVRWQSPEDGLVPPMKFVPVAEDSGLILPMGEWVLRTACAQAKAWQDRGLPPIQMAVNLSARQLAKKDLLESIAAALRETGLASEYLELEITESSLMERVDETMAVLREFRAMGIQLTVDDFGTGYSSLSYLKDFPLDALKIDRAFVKEIGHEGGGEMLAAAVIAIGQSLGLRVIAEGVENLGQLAFLRQQWCDEIQGFYFSRPIPANELEALVRSNPRL